MSHDSKPMGPANKRSNPLKKLWVSRRVIAAALVVGTLLWFILTNNQPATVYFPFGLGRPTAAIGLIVLCSAAAGSVATALVMTLYWAWRRYRPNPKSSQEVVQEIPDERPPADYAAQTGEGFSDPRWSAR